MWEKEGVWEKEGNETTRLGFFCFFFCRGLAPNCCVLIDFSA